MKLLRLELTNFRQHRKSLLEFTPGLTGIIGGNGAGKTTVVEAIAFALFGSRAIRGKVEDLKTIGVRDGELEVQLVFEINEQILRIVRTSNDADLFVGGESAPMVSGNREVVARVTTLLGMNYEEFVATYFTEQKGLEFLSGKKGATEREKFIVRMMGYDKLEKVQELLRTERRDKRNALLGWEAGIGDRSELEKQLVAELAELKILEAQYKEKCDHIERQGKENEEIKREFEKLEIVRLHWTKLRQGLTDLGNKFEDRSQRVKLIEREKAALLDRDLNGRSLREVLEGSGFEELVTRSQARVVSLQEQGTRIRNDVHAIEVKWKEARATIQSRVEITKKHLETLTNKAESISALDAKSPCPTCGQSLKGSFEQVKDDFNHQCLDSKGALEDLNLQLAALKEEPENIKREREILHANTEELKKEQEILIKLDGAKSASINLQRLEHELVVLRDELKQLDVLLSEERTEIAKLHFSEQDHSGKKAKHEAAHELLNIARHQKLQLEGDLKTKQALAGRTKEEINQFDNRVSELQSVKKDLVLLEEGDKVLTEFRKALNAGIKPRLAELSSEFLLELTDGRYTQVDIGADFTPSIVEEGEVKPVISGGEADILHLAVRLALSHMLAERAGQSFSLLVLDEVFGSLDEQRRSNVLTLLERLSHRFDQILVITHMDDIKDGVQHLLTVDYNEGLGASSVEIGSYDADLHI